MYTCISVYLSIDLSIYLYTIYLFKYTVYIYIDTNLIEGSLEAKLPTIWTVEKQR